MNREEELIKQGNKLFEKRSSLMSLWQEIGDNFYPQRADFLKIHDLGDEFAAHLMTSYPVLAHRDLADSFTGMLRPRSKKWFSTSVIDDERLSNGAKRWLEYASNVQFRAMYDRAAMFTRATKEGDHDYAAFGQTVISVEPSRDLTNLLYRCWHLRDCAWCENEEGIIDTIHRKWKPTARQMNTLFKGKVHHEIKSCLEKDPYREFEVRHIVIPADMYEGEKKYNTPFVSIFIDVENKFIMEETPRRRFGYVIPRWQTVSGSQYAYSPSTIVALSDARLIQAMTLTLLEAGEKAANPPMIAAKESVRSDIALYAGGITWIDAQHDGRLSDGLMPLNQDYRAMPYGLEMRNDVREMISECFYLNKLTLPPQGDMTAFEVSQRIQEYIRQAMPIFEPMEHEYNGALCEETFKILMDFNAFGPVEDIPIELLDHEIEFKFESPLHEAIEKEKGQKFLEASELLAAAAQIDPDSAVNFDAITAFRDALSGIGVPSKWITSEVEAAQAIAQNAMMRQIQQGAMMAQGGAEVAKSTAEASQAVSEAERVQSY